jgi:hypothetical protein
MASRRSLSEVAGLSITRVQLSSSFAGSASLSAVQTTGGAAAASALAARGERAVKANTALKANGEARDRMAGSLEQGRVAR